MIGIQYHFFELNEIYSQFKHLSYRVFMYLAYLQMHKFWEKQLEICLWDVLSEKKFSDRLTANLKTCHHNKNISEHDFSLKYVKV